MSDFDDATDMMKGDDKSSNMLQEGGVLYKIASFQYNNRIEDLMNQDVYVCSPDASVRDVAHKMSEQKISSIIVADDNMRPIGIVTERDMVRKVIAADAGNIKDKLIFEIMTPDPYCLSSSDSLFDSLYTFSRHNIKHLPIVDHGKVCGIITLRQIMKIRYSEPFVIIGELESARTPEDFRKIKEGMIQMVQEKLSSRLDPADIVAMISLVNNEIHRRLLEKVIREHPTKPPVDFCFFVTGSHGRKENLLFPDQDFCVILEDHDDSDREEYDRFFSDISKKFSDALNEAGYEYCSGNVMGTNPVWRKRLSDWNVHVSSILEKTGPYTVRYLTLLFDAAFLYGNSSLFERFSNHAYNQLSVSHNVLRMMHDEEEGRHKVPLGFFNTFITEKGDHGKQIDMKKSGLIFIIEAARILALKHGIRETSTLGRIQELVSKGVIQGDDSEYFDNAYRVILHHTLMAQADNYIAQGTSGYNLDPYSLSGRSQEILKQAFKAISKLQEIVGAEFGELIL